MIQHGRKVFWRTPKRFGMLVGAVCFGVLILAAVLVIFRGRKPENDPYTDTLARWSSLPYEKIDSTAKIRSAITRMRVFRSIDVSEEQQKLFVDACVEFMDLQKHGDIDLFIEFVRKRDMVLNPERKAALVDYAKNWGRDDLLKLDDPFEFFKAMEMEYRNKIGLGHIPTSCSTSNSYITYASAVKELPAAPPTKFPSRLYDGPHGGGGNNPGTFVSRISPEELSRQGYKVIWAELDVILQHQSGNPLAHDFIFFWNGASNQWVPNYYCWAFPSSIEVLMF